MKSTSLMGLTLYDNDIHFHNSDYAEAECWVACCGLRRHMESFFLLVPHQFFPLF